MAEVSNILSHLNTLIAQLESPRAGFGRCPVMPTVCLGSVRPPDFLYERTGNTYFTHAVFGQPQLPVCALRYI